MKPKISMITLGVADIARSVQFYRDGLSLPAPDYKDGDAMVMFALASSWLGLFPHTALAEDAGLPADGSGFRGVAIAHNEPSRDAVDVTFAEATAVKHPQEVFWGGYSGYFADPDGHLWEIAHNPLVDLT